MIQSITIKFLNNNELDKPKNIQSNFIVYHKGERRENSTQTRCGVRHPLRALFNLLPLIIFDLIKKNVSLF